MTEHLCSGWQSEDMLHSKTPQLEVNFRCFWQGCTRKPSGPFEQLLLLFFSAKLARWVASRLRAICIFCWVTLLLKWMLFIPARSEKSITKRHLTFFPREMRASKQQRRPLQNSDCFFECSRSYEIRCSGSCLMSGVIMNLFVCAHMLPREQQNHESFMV